MFTSYNGVARNRIARLNADGSLDFTFNPGLGVNDDVFEGVIQTDGKIIIGGRFSSYNGVARSRIARLNIDGSIDQTFNPSTGPNNTVQNIQLQNDGKIIIGGNFTSYNGTARSGIVRLNTDGSLDFTFSPGTGANLAIIAIEIQSNGQIIIGGGFTSYNGTLRNRIARINVDGSLDATFNPGSGANGSVFTMYEQNDGKIIIGGNFTSYNGTPRNQIARINVDGSLDLSFNLGTGANNSVSKSFIQNDGKIIIVGDFTSYNGIVQNYITRINTDGSLDTTFNRKTGTDVAIFSSAIQNDGKIIVGGGFSSYNGVSRNRIVRINSDGSHDASFNPGTGADNSILRVILQSDGKIIIAGTFTVYNGVSRNRIARLNGDGSLDLSFNPGTAANDVVRTCAIQNDGKIIIGGDFTSYNGTSRNRIARLNSDGSLDLTFNPGAGANNAIVAIAIQNDGQIIIGGGFTSYNGTSRNRIARVNNDGSLDGTYNPGTGANFTLFFIAIQNDGKVIIGGDFTSYNGILRNRIARINVDGSLDQSFNPGSGVGNWVTTIAIQSDGKIVIGGRFTTYNGIVRNRIARINVDGNLDTTFNPGSGANSDINTIAIQNNGRIILGGDFTSYSETGRNRIARILGEGCSIVLNSNINTENQSVCLNTSISNIIYNTSGNIGVTFIGLPPGVSGNYSSNVATISGTPTQTGTFNYSVTLTGTCSTAITKNITVTPNFIVVVSGANTICDGSSTTFSTSGGASYIWSTGATSAAITVSAQSTYSVTVTSSNGCISTGLRTLSVLPKPTASISGSGEICSNSSAIWTASGGVNYTWSTGASTTSINLTSPGTYTVTVTNNNGCTATLQKILTLSSNGTCATCSDGIKNGNETGIDCGGSCPPCGSCINMIVEIKTDKFPKETSWYIKNSSGTTVASGGNYTFPYTLNTHSFCLPDGCYTFNISDTYGDGLLSPGYYRVSEGNTALLNFQAYEFYGSYKFCLGSAALPSCTDGIKNGNETGIDCGGSCPACPTCSDGLKNGNEIEVDCGGSCPPCGNCSNIRVEIRTDQYPTEISWSIKNSSGILMASSPNYTLQFTLNTHTYCLPIDCYTFTINDVHDDGILPPGYFKVSLGTTVLVSNSVFTSSKSLTFCLGNAVLPTCSDHIKNGYETGIDCGGPCTPCPTCTDGIKNGSETGIDCGGPCYTCYTGTGRTVTGTYFEEDWGEWTNGVSGAYRARGAYSAEGAYSIRLKGSSGSQSFITCSRFDLTSYDSVTIEFKFRAIEMEPSKFISLLYHNGWYWTTVGTYTIGDSFINNQVYTIIKTLAGPFPNNAKFRIQSDASWNLGEVYIDAAIIRGIGGTNLNKERVTVTRSIIENVSEGVGISILPNPTKNMVSIITEEQILKIQLFNLSGQMLLLQPTLHDNQLDLSSLVDGVYIIRVQTDNDIYMDRLIKM